MRTAAVEDARAAQKQPGETTPRTTMERHKTRPEVPTADTSTDTVSATQTETTSTRSSTRKRRAVQPFGEEIVNDETPSRAKSSRSAKPNNITRRSASRDELAADDVDDASSPSAKQQRGSRKRKASVDRSPGQDSPVEVTRALPGRRRKATNNETSPDPGRIGRQQSRRTSAAERRRLNLTDNIGAADTEASEHESADLGACLNPALDRPVAPTDPQADLDVIEQEEEEDDADDSTDPDLEVLRNLTLAKLTGRQPIPLKHVADEYAKVKGLLHQTVTAGEGNSMLLIGPRGVGKTALVNSVLADLSHDHANAFHTIRLNGFLQTDDRLALREIWRQLGREMDVEDDPNSRNYADALSSLLALLAHPSELSNIQAQPDKNGEPLIPKSVLFIIDEFDLFATHARQTLLYNLFDIAQARKAPIAILGLTTRVDVPDLLEKRVKSRFSHRSIFLPFPRTYTHFTDIVSAALHIDPSELATHDHPPPPKTLESYNAAISTLLASPATHTTLIQIYITTRSPPTALTALFLPVSLLPLPPRPSTSSYPPLLPPASPLHHLPSLHPLALALLITTARLEIIHATPTAAGDAPSPANFNAAYAEYVAAVAKARLATSTGGIASLGGAAVGGRVWGRAVARAAWEALMRARLLVPLGAAQGDADMVRCEVALEEVEGAAGADMPGGLRRWVREI